MSPSYQLELLLVSFSLNCCIFLFFKGILTCNYIFLISMFCFMFVTIDFSLISFVEPRFVINYLQTLKSSEEMLKEQVSVFYFYLSRSNIKRVYFPCMISSIFFSYYQLEKAKKKEAAFIVTFAKREQEIAELKVRLYSVLFSFSFLFQLIEIHFCTGYKIY